MPWAVSCAAVGTWHAFGRRCGRDFALDVSPRRHKSSRDATIVTMSDYRAEREQRERRRRNIMRAVCIVIAAAMLVSLVIPAVYAGL